MSESSTQSPERLAELQAQVRELERQLLERSAQIRTYEQHVRILEEALRVMRADRYGASREKLSEAPGQRSLFNEVEVLMDTAKAVDFEPDLTATPLRESAPKKGKPGRKALASHLPRVEVRHELTETERVCGCGSVLREFDVETSEQLDYVPAKIRVLRHVKAKYACACCQASVRVAPMPPQVLPRTNASPGLLAQIATAKYVDGLPLYRLETVAERHGVNLPRATQAAWMIGLVEPLQPLINLMDERMRSSGYVRIDETPMQVLKSDKPASADHWMWVRVAGPPKERLILFDHDPSRSSEVAERLLDGCHGYVQSDGYAAYDGVAVRLKLTHVGCMAHARRRFFEAIEALPHSERKKETAAHEMVRRIDALYTIERENKTRSPDERATERRERALPLLDQLIERAYALQNQTLPSGKLGEALAYLTKQWTKLSRYVEDGRLEIDTNLAENAIRPFARGRRAWLFADSVSGAKASALLYSLVESAKANGLEPYSYLRGLFERLPRANTVADYEALLPFAMFAASDEAPHG
jgi:transposase